MKVEEEGTKGILYRRDIICKRTACIKQEIIKFLKNQSHLGTLCAFNLKGGIADVMLYND